MAVNNRIFYACQAVGLRKMGQATSVAPTIAHGVQSVGITTNFNLEQAFELGQIQIYENIEGLPDVEVTLEKVLDGYPLLFHLATAGAEAAGLVGRSKARADLHLGIFSDANDSIGDDADGKPDVEVYCSGMYAGSVSYTIPIDGNATESLTLTGNNKEWQVGSARIMDVPAGDGFGSDAPKAFTDISGGVQRRENVRLDWSYLPASIHGVNASSKGNGWNSTTNSPLAHLQSISISTDFARDDLLELGRKTPYFRAPGFPIEVTCEIECYAVSGDFISAYEEGDPTFFTTSSTSSGDNTSEEKIVISLQDSTAFDLGTKNRLSSVSYGGGDATGGNVSLTYSYSNFNVLNVLHQQDPWLSAGVSDYSPAQSGYMYQRGV